MADKITGKRTRLQTTDEDAALQIAITKKGPTLDRWQTAVKDKAFDPLRRLIPVSRPGRWDRAPRQ